MSAIHTWRSAFAGVVLLAGCASGAPDAPVERDVQLATRGDTVLAWADGRTYYFSNAPAPICFAFDVPGEWHFGRQPGVVRRTDEQALVGVTFVHGRDHGGLGEDAMITRLLESWTRDSEAEFGRRLTWTIAPFEARRPAVAWQGDWVAVRGRRVKPLARVAARFPDGWVAAISVGAANWEALARHVLEVLTTSAHRDCYWPVIRQRFGYVRG